MKHFALCSVAGLLAFLGGCLTSPPCTNQSNTLGLTILLRQESSNTVYTLQGRDVSMTIITQQLSKLVMRYPGTESDVVLIQPKEGVSASEVAHMLAEVHGTGWTNIVLSVTPSGQATNQWRVQQIPNANHVVDDPEEEFQQDL